MTTSHRVPVFRLALAASRRGAPPGRRTRLRSAAARGRTLVATVAAGLAATMLAGCVTVRDSFPGEDAARVWDAMVAVARTPDYDRMEPEERWRVLTNRVWIDPDRPRLEIYREVARWSRLTSARPARAWRTWRFQVLLEAADPPAATLQSRGAGVPRHAREEADRFFAQVRRLLGVPEPRAETGPLSGG